MLNTRYLTFEQVIVIHDSQIELYGGGHGIRELVLLESAVMRPQTTFAGRDLYQTVFEKAAVLMHSLIMNHPFVDGNKRTGTASALVFFEINQLRITAGQTKLVELALKIESKKMSMEDIADWFKKYSKRI